MFLQDGFLYLIVTKHKLTVLRKKVSIGIMSAGGLIDLLIIAN
jgi:hypothetical protein